MLYDVVIPLFAVGNETFTTVFDATRKNLIIATAVFAFVIERAKTEQAVEGVRVACFMAWKIFALCVLKVFVVFHRISRIIN